MADETKDESGHFSFPETEEAVLAKWRKNSTFLNSVKRNENLEHYTFYDGPPFATGLPHYGHLLAGTIKDVVTRFAAMDGHFVQRRFGWDTHGLPVEFEIDKLLGIKGPSDVYKMGVKSYNDKCREIVMRYAGEWRTTVERVGRWIDFDNDYKTLYVTFMESVWWVFAQLVKKDLVYRGVKVMPYSTGCSTPLSNFEAGQNYKDVADPAVFVAFPLADNPNRRLVAWTTTPWTLPSNLALSVHPDMQYVVIKDPQHGHELVLLESALKRLWKKPNVKDIVEKFPGSKLKGLKYTPPFEYFKHLDQGQLFRVLTATFVTDDAGTGVVHQAPYFGEIDYATCIEHGVITKEQKMVCPVDEKGLFTAEVTDFAGQYVKDADKNIIADLKKRGILVKAEQITHSYPFCWRSETPLLYKAVPSWFIKVETLVPQLLKNNAQTRWVPEHVREKRFGNWLRDARDWAVSRNRFWGTPINLWVSDDYEEWACPESVAELKEMAGYTGEINDIHRHWIDDITIKSKKTGKTLRRVPEIFDCWFESGSMPYASQHYPFENKDIFEQNFPADFIAEGIDQTRGWFYTLLVLSTALFDKPPFKNLICNGLVLASDGTKMSKSKRNFPDPMKIVHEYGADALRLYLINSPAVRGENLRFREQGVRDIVKDVLLPWHNAYRFYSQCVHFYEHTSGKKFVPHDGDVHNIMDKWIYSFTTSLIKFVREKMADYHLFAVVSPLMKFFEALTNCYIRLNRNRMKSPVDEDRLAALSCLNFVLSNICRLMAPFTPFYCEYLWAKLNNVSEDQDESVHYHQLPPVVPKYIDVKVEKEVAAMRSVIELVRLLRERSGISVRYPVSEIVIVHHSQEWLDNVRVLESFLQSECNVKDIKYTTDRKKHGVSLKANIDFKSLGARLQKEQKPVADYLKNKVTQDELETFMDTKTMTVAGHAIGPEDLSVVYTYDPTTNEDPGEWVVESDAEVVVQLNSALNNELLKEGTIRELINRVMQLRKSHGLFHTQHASASLANIDESLRAVLESSQTTIEQATNTALKLVAAGQSLENPTNFKIRDASFDVVLQFEKLAV